MPRSDVYYDDGTGNGPVIDVYTWDEDVTKRYQFNLSTSGKWHVIVSQDFFGVNDKGVK